MKLRITARGFDLTDDVKNHADHRIGALSRFFDRIVDAQLTLSTEKHRRIAELVSRVPETTLTSRGEADDIFVAIDESTSKMETQIKKYKTRLKDRDQKTVADFKQSGPVPIDRDDES